MARAPMCVGIMPDIRISKKQHFGRSRELRAIACLTIADLLEGRNGIGRLRLWYNFRPIDRAKLDLLYGKLATPRTVQHPTRKPPSWYTNMIIALVRFTLYLRI